MKVKLDELINIKPSLEKIAKEYLPVKTAFKLGKFIKNIDKEYIIFEEERKKLFNKYGEQKGKEINIKPENKDEFTKEFEELLSIEVDIKIEKIKLEELGDIKLSGLDFANLDILIEE